MNEFLKRHAAARIRQIETKYAATARFHRVVPLQQSKNLISSNRIK